VIKLYSRPSISAKTCGSATNAPSFPKTVLFEPTIRSISTTKNQQAEPCLRRDFWNELASRNNLTACCEVRAGPEWPEWRPERANHLALC
jgi:hypothetical protein